MRNRSFDNGPIQRMQIAVMKKITMLGWAGCEVKSVRLDSFKAVIHVEPCNGLVAQFHDKEFGVIEDGEIRVVWRVSDTESGRVHHD